jgi:hypothetical protein
MSDVRSVSIALFLRNLIKTANNHHREMFEIENFITDEDE